MPEKCVSCGSCGMRMETPEDHALGDEASEYCRYCTDAHGRLLPYEVVLQSTARGYVESQGVAPSAAERMAALLLADMPAWKNRAVSRA